MKADTVTKDFISDPEIQGCPEVVCCRNRRECGVCALWGENQSEIHYAMAVKNKLYDEKEMKVDVCQEIQMFGFLHTYKLLLYPNFFTENCIISASCLSESLDLIYSI